MTHSKQRGRIDNSDFPQISGTLHIHRHSLSFTDIPVCVATARLLVVSWTKVLRKLHKLPILAHKYTSFTF